MNINGLPWDYKSHQIHNCDPVIRLPILIWSLGSYCLQATLMSSNPIYSITMPMRNQSLSYILTGYKTCILANDCMTICRESVPITSRFGLLIVHSSNINGICSINFLVIDIQHASRDSWKLSRYTVVRTMYYYMPYETWHIEINS